MRPIRWRAWITGLGLLVLGGVVGVHADRVLHRSGDRHARLLAEVHRDPLAVMQRELDLTPDQRTRIAAILAARQGRMDSVWHETQQRLRATIDTLSTEITALLDSGQAARFRELAEAVHGSPVPPSRLRH